MKDTVYIFGHKNPDTDSVCAAISLSYLQNKLGLNTEPRILSQINDETKFVLKKLKINTPELLNDVKLQIFDIDYQKDFKVNYKEPIYTAIKKMLDCNLNNIPVVNDNNKFLGLLSIRDIIKTSLNQNIIELNTKYDYIKEVLDGKETLKFNENINGYISTTNKTDNNKYIYIIDSNNYKDNNVDNAILLIIANSKLDANFINEMESKKINIISTKENIESILLKLGYTTTIEHCNFDKYAICINQSMYVSDFKAIVNKTKNSNYPVVDNKNNCLGLIKIADLNDSHPKKVILVDHNEILQSADGLEEAQILGIVDHHKLGNLGTNWPINFRNMTVGSTCTIIYHLFIENKISIPKDIATLLLSGLISDTVLLKSPTTTENDIKVFNSLVKMTNINPQKYALEMFKANDVLNSKSLKEIIYNDCKTFNINKKVVTISQITTLNSKAILKQKNSYVSFLNKECKNKDYHIMILIITDIFKNGSYVLFNNSALDIIKDSLGEETEEGTFIPGLISRKKQLLPLIINSIY